MIHLHITSVGKKWNQPLNAIYQNTYIQNRVLLYIRSVNHTRKELCINYTSVNTSNFTGFLCLIN